MGTQTAVPWSAFVPLLIGRVSAGGTFSVVFPFLPSFLRDLGLQIRSVAFWTGFAESAWMAAELVTAIPMSWLSDRWGRRPVLIATMLWSAVTCVCLGMSTSVTQVVMWRLLNGISGMRQVGRVMLGELSTKDNRVRMFSFFTPAGTIGTMLGRLIGGVLSKPYGRIPWLGDMFKDYPYLLPLLVVGTWPFVGFLSALKYMKETKPAALSRSSVKPSMRLALQQPGLLELLLAFTISQTLETAMFSATTLISSVTVADGGFGLTTPEIGYFLVGLSLCFLVAAPTTLNVLAHKFTMQQNISMLSSVWLLLPPIFSIAVHHAKSSKSALILDLVVFAVVRAAGNSCFMFYDMIAIDLSSPELLSSTNACLTLFGGVGRLLGPASFGSLKEPLTRILATRFGRMFGRMGIACYSFADITVYPTCDEKMRSLIPWGLFLPLLLGQLSEAAVSFSVYPFLPSFIQSLGQTPHGVSFYTGLAESSLLAVEACLALPVARLSNRWGRRRLYIGMLAWLAITCSALGTSSTIAGIVVWRMLAGLSGVRAIARTMLFEISNEENRVSMLAIYEPSSSAGALFGRLCGGVFAAPSGRIPGVGDWSLFQSHPFLLPGLIVACLPIIAVIVSLLFLHEPGYKDQPIDKSVSKNALRQPGLLPLLLANGCSIALDNACSAAISLLASLSTEDGGLGLQMQTISWILCFQTVMYIIISPRLLHLLTARFDKVSGIIILTSLWPLLIASYMVMIYHAKHNPSWLPIDIVIHVLLRVTAGSIWSFYDLAVMDISSPELLASSNGWYTIFAAVGGACGPFTFGAVFGHTTKYEAGSLGRQTVWLVMLVTMLVPLPLLRLARKATMDKPTEYEVLPMGDEARLGRQRASSQ